MNFFIRAYLRASTEEQNASRARETLEQFVNVRGLRVCNYYIENESGAKLERPELFRLVNDCSPNDVLLIEDVDRLSRLNEEDWKSLKLILQQKDIRIVAVNVPTTWSQLEASTTEFDGRMFSAINNMLIDFLAAFARRDYEQRRERQNQGIKAAREGGKYKGRPVDVDKYKAINDLLLAGWSWSRIQKNQVCSRTTIAKAKSYFINEASNTK